jgi:hypothetical protein
VVSGGYFEDRFDFHGEPEWQCSNPDGGAGRPADLVAEDADQEIGCAVGDQVLFGEVEGGVDVDHHFHEGGDADRSPTSAFTVAKAEDIVCRTDSTTLIDLHLKRLGYSAALREGRVDSSARPGSPANSAAGSAPARSLSSSPQGQPSAAVSVRAERHGGLGSHARRAGTVAGRGRRASSERSLPARDDQVVVERS